MKCFADGYEYALEERKGERIYLADNQAGEKKAFLVERLGGDDTVKTLELRCEDGLSKLLREKYETVMESRYFGRGGIEIVPSGQLEENELEDLVRLSYNLSRE